MAQIRGSAGCRGANQVPPPSGNVAPPPPAGSGTGTGSGSSTSPSGGGTSSGTSSGGSTSGAGTSGSGGSGGTGGSGGSSALIDILTYMVPPLTFSQSFHMASTQPGVNPIYVYQQPVTNQTGYLWYIKNIQGFPWDGHFYDQNYIYHIYTEGPTGWTDATSFKAFDSTTFAPANHGGIGWSPRYIQPAPATNSLTTTDTTYRTYLNTQVVETQQLGQQIMTQVQGPYNLANGALGTQPTMVLSYFWGDTTPTREDNWYVYGYGQTRWRNFELSNGVYQLTQESIFDKVTAGGTPQLVPPNPLQ